MSTCPLREYCIRVPGEGTIVLGVLLNDNLNDNEHMKQMRGLYARANSVLRKFAACSFEVKLRLFQAFCTRFYCANCGLNLPNMLCPRSEWHIIMFFTFCLDIEEVAVPAKCLSPIIFITLEVVCENILMILLCGLAAAVIYLIATLSENSFILAGPLRQKWVRRYHL